MRLLCFAAVLHAGLALADTSTLLYDNPVPLVTSSRLVGLAGAAVGVAENSESLPFNYASVAQRSPHRARGFDIDVTFDVLFSPANQARDIDNDPAATQQIIAPVETQLGGYVQFSRFGVGGYARLSQRGICVMSDPLGLSCASTLQAQQATGAIVFGWNLWRDQLVFGAGFTLASAEFDVGNTALKYFGFSVGGGALWRPAFLPFRIGISGVTQTYGKTDNMMQTIAGRPAFAGLIAPARISIGGSVRLGQGAWRYNRLSLSAMKELPESYNVANVPHDLEPDDPRPPGRFLIAAQLDLILPVKNATTMRTFLNGEAPVQTGASLSLVPRLGTETEVVDHILRLRLGTYLEPALIAGTSTRPHATFGFEVFLLHLLFDWSVSAAGDVADRYFSMSLGLGWWS
jgi:hypothetical protein